MIATGLHIQLYDCLSILQPALQTVVWSSALQLEQRNPKAGVKPYDIPVAPLLLTAAAPGPANHHPVDQLTSQMQRELHAMRCRLVPQRSDNGGPGAVVLVGLVLAIRCSVRCMQGCAVRLPNVTLACQV